MIPGAGEAGGQRARNGHPGRGSRRRPRELGRFGRGGRLFRKQVARGSYMGFLGAVIRRARKMTFRSMKDLTGIRYSC